MPRTVKTIPATISRFTATPINAQKKRRVAGYARVSTDSDEQFTSYEAQVDYYTNYTKSRDDWEFVEVYTDEGIRRNKRTPHFLNDSEEFFCWVFIFTSSVYASRESRMASIFF